MVGPSGTEVQGTPTGHFAPSSVVEPPVSSSVLESSLVSSVLESLLVSESPLGSSSLDASAAHAGTLLMSSGAPTLVVNVSQSARSLHCLTTAIQSRSSELDVHCDGVHSASVVEMTRHVPSQVGFQRTSTTVRSGSSGRENPYVLEPVACRVVAQLVESELAGLADAHGVVARNVDVVVTIAPGLQPIPATLAQARLPLEARALYEQFKWSVIAPDRGGPLGPGRRDILSWLESPTVSGSPTISW